LKSSFYAVEVAVENVAVVVVVIDTVVTVD